MSQKGLLFAGDFLFSVLKSDGNWTPYEQVEVDKLAITTPSDLKEKMSKGRSTYGQSFVSQPVAKPSEFEITFSEVTRKIFAMQLSGVLGTLTEDAATLTAVDVVAALDAWVDLGHRNINPVGFSVTNSGATTTYDADVDYVLNPRLGMLKALSTGAITDAEALKVTGASLAIAGERITGASQYKTTIRFRLDGINLVNNEDVIVSADQAVISSSAAYDFLQSEISEAPLKGRLEIATAGQAPFVLDYIGG